MNQIQPISGVKIPADVLPKIYRYSGKETQNNILSALNKDMYNDQFKNIRTNKIIEHIQCMDPQWLESTRIGLGVKKVLDVVKHGLGILKRDGGQLTDEQRKCAFLAAARNLGDHEIMQWMQPNEPVSDLYSPECIRDAIFAAARNGNLASVEYWQPLCNDDAISGAIMGAAKKGHKDVLLFLMPFNTIENFYLISQLLIFAADHGWSDLVKNMLEKINPENMSRTRCEAAFSAAKNGHIKLAEDLLRSHSIESNFSAYFRAAINLKCLPVIQVFAQHPQYILSHDRDQAVICAARHGNSDLLHLLLICSKKSLLSGTKYYEISDVARGAAVVALSSKKQPALLRLLLKSGSIKIADRQRATSIAAKQNDQESVSILNGG